MPSDASNFELLPTNQRVGLSEHCARRRREAFLAQLYFPGPPFPDGRTQTDADGGRLKMCTTRMNLARRQRGRRTARPRPSVICRVGRHRLTEATRLHNRRRRRRIRPQFVKCMADSDAGRGRTFILSDFTLSDMAGGWEAGGVEKCRQGFVHGLVALTPILFAGR